MSDNQKTERKTAHELEQILYNEKHDRYYGPQAPLEEVLYSRITAIRLAEEFAEQEVSAAIKEKDEMIAELTTAFNQHIKVTLDLTKVKNERITGSYMGDTDPV